MAQKSKTPRKPATKPRKAKAPARPVGESIIGHAMLVNLNIKVWGARKLDRSVTEATNTQYKATKDAGRYNKHLFGGRTAALSAIITAESQLRDIHYTQTLPWADTGWRLLPTANYIAYTDKVREARQKFDAAVDAFIGEYPAIVQAAKDRLQDMYNEADYPDAAQIRRRYGVVLEFMPLPNGDDFRINLPEQEMARITRKVEERVRSATEEAVANIWKRLGDAIHHLRTRVADGKQFRATMVPKLVEVVETVGRLNLTGDARLNEVRAKVLAELGTLDVEDLRSDEDVRKEAVAKADKILASMAVFYTPSEDVADADA